MKVRNVSVHVVRAALRQPFSFSQWTYTHRETALVRVETDAGLVGWGEAFGLVPVAAEAVRCLLGPMLIGRDPRDVEALWHLLFARSLDYGQKGSIVAAIGAIDIACWDLKAQSAGVPLYRLLGGAETEAIDCYATGLYSTRDRGWEEALAQEAESHLERGFRAMKMKVGFGIERDACMVAHVRKVIGPGVKLMIDANHAYSAAEAIRLARLVEQHDIFWFEEPVSPIDLASYEEVKRSISISIAGGECEYTRFGFEPLLRRRLVDFAQPDLCICGGITEGMKIATLASVYGVHVTPHVWGTVIGPAAALHFYAARCRHPGTLTPETKLIECDQTENPLRSELIPEQIRFDSGRWMLPQTPGLGVTIREQALPRFAVA